MSLLESLANSISAQVAIAAANIGSSELPHLHEAAPSEILDKTRPPPHVFEAFQKIIADAQALISLLQPAKQHLLDVALRPSETQALRVAVDWEIASTIAASGGNIELGKLAQRHNTDPHKLGCILRTLVNRHIFRESSPGVFSNNRHSYALINDARAKQFLRFMTIEAQNATTGMQASMEDSQKAFSYKPEDAPFGIAFKTEKDAFGWMMEPDHSRSLEDAMDGVPWLNSVTVYSLIYDYPWEQYGTNAKVVDLGCGPGTTALSLLKRHPGLELTLVDLPSMTSEIQKLWQTEWPDVLQSGQVRIEAHDYFTECHYQADIYFMRGVLREYSDEDAIKLLAAVVPALKKNPAARLLVNEIILPTLVISDTDTKNNKPVSDYIPGQQSSCVDMAHLMTMNTWTMFGGKERTFEEMKSVIEKAGLRIDKFYKFRTFTVMIECCVAE